MELSEKVRCYIENVKLALTQLEGKVLSDQIKKVVDLVRCYVSDAEYYLNRGCSDVALACIAYAEGLLDALRLLGLAEFSWRSITELSSRPKVFVAGTFELLHPGHIYLLRKAYEIGQVHVVIARDVNVARLKGREPIVPEEQRLEVIRSIRYVSTARLGSLHNFFEPLLEIKPDIILLGPDQDVDESKLTRYLEERGVTPPKILRLNEKYNRFPLCSSSKIIAEVIRRYGSRGEFCSTT